MGEGKVAEDALMFKLAGVGSRHGTTWFGRLGDVTKRPPMWAVIAGAIAVTGPRGRQAAFRGGVTFVAAAVAHLPLKLLCNRRRPPGAHRFTVSSSFPSGHCASELAFSMGAAQEVPWLIVPLYAATLAGEWSMVRSQAHYPSDIFAGAAVGIVVALVAQKVWPTQRSLAKGHHGLGPENVDDPASVRERRDADAGDRGPGPWRPAWLGRRRR